MSIRIVAAWLAAFLLAAFFIAACGGGEDDSGTTFAQAPGPGSAGGALVGGPSSGASAPFVPAPTTGAGGSGSGSGGGM
ncbi:MULTISPECIES: hypothetical protein [unclassified Cupriavidus]|uniref:hypothetical protein n=1 Tax=unclassified Cupriavidus TaxID=2640874 RepID=UPI000881EFD2|nr:hypothetical protein [Cupriavidus sp. YR651]SDD53080.1 hypothetical protein SAMN05216345_110170 [Cupriavidus sp. YR651]